jgi:hypothetical protein
MKKLERETQVCLYENCNENIVIIVGSKKPTRKFCSMNCKNLYFKGKKLEEIYDLEKAEIIRKKISSTVKGINNPNYGNTWTLGQKEKQSILIKNKVDEEYRLNCSKGMKGKSVSKETKEKKRKTEAFKKQNGYVRPSMTNKTREKIGKSSSERFKNLSFLEKIRKSREDKGNWLKLKDKDEYKFYSQLSNWKYSMFDFKIKNIESLSKIGLFNSKTNSYGLVRDHIYSRMDGFKNLVFPEILRHPINCQLITHGQNISKGCKSEISLEELFINIENDDNNYPDQNICLELIQKYRNGERYNKNFYIKYYYETN